MKTIETQTDWVSGNHLPNDGSLRNRVGRYIAQQPVPAPIDIPYSLSDSINRTREVHAEISPELRAVEQRILARRTGALARTARLSLSDIEAQHDDRSLARQLNTQRARVTASLSGAAMPPEPKPHTPLERVRLGPITTLVIPAPAHREQGTQWSFSAPDI